MQGPPAPETSEPAAEEEGQTPAEDVAVRYTGSGTFNVAGSVSGALYSFQGHGAILPVHAEDAPALLEMERRRQRCCGRGVKVIRYFEPA